MKEDINNLIYTLEIHHISSEPVINLMQENKGLTEQNLRLSQRHWTDNKRLKELEQIEKEHKEENGRLRDRIKELEEYANWHIEHLTEDILDYIDDDKVGNASLIGEFKEEREHWRDINRILNNKETYIDYKNY